MDNYHKGGKQGSTKQLKTGLEFQLRRRRNTPFLLTIYSTSNRLFTIGFCSRVTVATASATAATATRPVTKETGNCLAFTDGDGHHVDGHVRDKDLVDQRVFTVPVVETGRQKVMI